MTEPDLLQALARGEDSRQQFKRDATNADGMAAELAALANSGGGTVFLGVADDGSIAGLDAADVRRLNQLISNAASQHVRPPLHPQTDNVQTAQGLVLVVQVGVQVSGYFLQRMKTKWGSCNHSAGHIRLNTELVKKPKDLLEYVVVHEMVHLLEPNHSEAFAALLDRHFPTWREARAELNELPLAATA